MFTLAVCGVPRDDPVVERGLRWLRKGSERDHTSYESSALILMLTALNGVEAPRKVVWSENRRKPPTRSRFNRDDWEWMDERVQHLLACQQAGGGFGYWDEEPGYADVSATQFAALALRAASFAGYPLSDDVWQRMADFHRSVQHASGGFPYRPAFAPSRGMTAAAVSSLIICREQIGLLRAREPAWAQDAVDRALAWLGTNFDVTSNPSQHLEGEDSYHYAHLYAIERVGILSGRAEFGGKAWYARGAAYLLEEQDKSGRWRDDTCMKPEDVLGSCFALLFLKRATFPPVTRRT
jgi:hypothetical protein